MKTQGNAVAGICVAEGYDKAIKAAKLAIKFPLFKTDITLIKNLLVSIAGSFNMTLNEGDYAVSSLTDKLNYIYLGAVIKGGSAGTYMMPEKMNKKLFKKLDMLGEHFEINGSFDIKVVKKLANTNKLSKGKCRMAGIR